MTYQTQTWVKKKGVYSKVKTHKELHAIRFRHLVSHLAYARAEEGFL